jgi:hypothetical protein
MTTSHFTLPLLRTRNIRRLNFMKESPFVGHPITTVLLLNIELGKKHPQRNVWFSK